MYNESIKQEFISAYTTSASNRKVVQRVFTSTEKYEAEYCTDFSQMDRVQMQRTLDEIVGIRTQSAESMFFVLKEYVKWCSRNGIRTSDAISDVRIDAIERVRSHRVANPGHLKLSLDTVFPHPELNSIEYIYRAMLWLAFMGFEDFEAIKVKESEVDLKNMLIHYAGSREPYMIYAEAVPDIREACDAMEFIEPRGKDGVKKQRASGDTILRGKVSKKSADEQLESTFRQTISRAFKVAIDSFEKNGIEIPRSLSLNLSYSRILLSGIMYRAYTREQIGIPPNAMFAALVEKEVKRKMEAKEYTININRTENKIRTVLMKGYIDDYARWKCAFTT